MHLAHLSVHAQGEVFITNVTEASEQAQALIGGGTSGPTIALAQKVTIPGNALIIAPSATAIAITNLEGANAASGERLV